jgi:tetratricopeptide (TPR) repeat protein/predicted Ser/Thr protein kinase
MPLSAGDKLGPYEILALSGTGGMGDVYKARDTRLERFVALKQLKSNQNQRFRKEALAIAALNHPNICQVYDVGENYLIMEFVEGKPLYGPLPEEDAIKLAAQIILALEEAHARGILHRDLKPGNILLTDNGSVKLIDFGLAKSFNVDPIDATVSSESNIVGTFAYMAPEQAQGHQVDARSDIFSFGAVLYEMLSGKRAFQGDSTAAVFTALLRDDPAPLPVSPRMQQIVNQCLAKKPADRFRSMVELKVEFEDLIREGSGVHSFIGSLPSAPPMQTNVGRDSERDRIWRAYKRVKEGRGLILNVIGEAGIGKTSVIEAFLADLPGRAERPVIGRGRCSQRLAGEEPYLPILEVLDSLLRPVPNPAAANIMKTVAPTWYALAAHDFSAPTGGSLQRSEPGTSQERMKRELAALCQEISRTQPFVIFIDDLHWADISTIDIINYLASHFDRMRLFVLGSYRPSDMALRGNPFRPIRNDMLARGVLEEMALDFLERQDVDLYLSIEFPDHNLPSNFSSLIHSKTEGNPLFMADLVRYLRDTGGIVEEDGHWALARSLPQAPRDLPASMRSMIERKIDQVEERDLKLLFAASVQGPEFDSAVIAQAIEMDPADVEDRLDILEKIHVFVRRGSEDEFPDRSLTLNYQFVHVLYQNALYDSLPPTRRATLSGRVARALAERHGDQVKNVAARVAVLLETARDFSASAHYYYQAAGRSAELFAFREALALAERGLKAVHSLPEGPARKQQELALQMIKGTALRSTSGWSTPQIESVFSQARQLVQDLDEPPELIPVLWATTLFHLIRGSLHECRASADEMMTLAVRSGGQSYLMAAHHIGGVVREFLGDMVESSRLLERCRELHAPADNLANLATYGQDPGMTGRAMSARPLWALGYPDRAKIRALETVALSRELGQPLMIAFALVVLQGIHLYRGEAPEALAIGEEIIALCSEYELPQEAEWSRSFQGYALHLLGRTEEGIEVLKRALDAQKAISAGLVRSAFLALLADCLRHSGRTQEGFEAIKEGLAHAEEKGEGGYKAELFRVRGELFFQVDDKIQAEASMRKGVEYAAQQQAKSFQLRSATALARLLRSDGRNEEARNLLSPVYNWFTEGLDTTDLVSARTLLSEMG